MSNIEKTFPKISKLLFSILTVFSQTIRFIYLKTVKNLLDAIEVMAGELEFFKKYDLLLSVMSSEVNPVVLRRCEKLNLECYHQLKDSKYKCFLHWCEKKYISF